MVQFVGVTIDVTWRKTFAYQVSVVVILPTVVVSELVFQPSVAPDAVIAPIDVGTNQRSAVADTGGFQPCPHINLGLLHRCDGGDNFVGPVGKAIELLLFYGIHHRLFTTCLKPVQKSTFLPQLGQHLTTMPRTLTGAGSIIVPLGKVRSLTSVWQQGHFFVIMGRFIFNPFSQESRSHPS